MGRGGRTAAGWATVGAARARAAVGSATEGWVAVGWVVVVRAVEWVEARVAARVVRLEAVRRGRKSPTRFETRGIRLRPSTRSRS